MYGYLLVYAETFAITLFWLEILDALKKRGKFVSISGLALRDLLPYATFLCILPWVLPQGTLMTALLATFLLVGIGGLIGVISGHRSRPLPLLELVACVIIAQSGILIQFFSSPLGGYLYLDRASLPLTVLWLFFFTQFMKLANRLSGLFTGMMALFSYLVIGALLTQRVSQAGAPILAVALAGTTTCMWLAGYRYGPRRMTRPAASVWAVTAAVASVVSTSKRVAFIALLTPTLLIVAPLIFFTLLISMSYIGPKVRKLRRVYRWNLTPERLVNVVMIFCLMGNLILLSHLFVDKLAWTIGLVAVALTVFLQTARLILLRGTNEGCAPPTTGTVEVLGTNFLVGGMPAARKKVLDFLRHKDKARFVITPDALALLRSLVEEDYCNALKEADMVIPDGAGVVWAGDIIKEEPILTRTPGVELVDEILDIADNEKLGVFLLGTRDEVLNDAAAEIKRRHPNLRLVGQRNGYFTEEEEREVLVEIKKSGADVLLVAMGVPKQELWMRNHRNVLPVRLMIGCGGSLDVMAGHVVRAPKWLQKLGLEFLWRVLREPTRVKRALLLPVFVFEVLRQKVRMARGKSGGDDEDDNWCTSCHP